MKHMLIAVGIFLFGFVLLDFVPEVEVIPAGVRTIMDDVAGIW